MAEQSPTDNGGVQSSSDSRSNDESLLDKTAQDQSADEQQDTDSGDATSQDSGSDSSTDSAQSTDESTSSDDDGLAKFAKSQGIDDLGALSDREKQLLKVAHDNVRDKRKEMKQEADELKSSIQEVHSDDVDETLTESEQREQWRDQQIRLIAATQRTNEFYERNPEARELNKEMAQLLREEAEKRGKEAAVYLGQDLDRLYILAKARRGDNDAEAAREAGRREEREALRRKQEGSADSAHATQPVTPQKKVDRAWIENEYDPSNPEHQRLMDEALASGDLYR